MRTDIVTDHTPSTPHSTAAESTPASRGTARPKLSHMAMLGLAAVATADIFQSASARPLTGVTALDVPQLPQRQLQQSNNNNNNNGGWGYGSNNNNNNNNGGWGYGGANNNNNNNGRHLLADAWHRVSGTRTAAEQAEFSALFD